MPSAPSFRLLTETESPQPATSTRGAVGPIWKAHYAHETRDLGVKNLKELFESSAAEHANRPCLGHRPIGTDGNAGPYTFLTYREVASTVAAVHAGFISLGVQPKDHVGVIGANSPEWMMTVQALNRMNGVCVPLYDTLGEQAVEYVLTHASIKLIMAQASKLPVIARLLGNGGAKGVVTAGIVYWGDAPQDALQLLASAGVNAISWDQLVAKGKLAPVPAESASIDDMCTIMYTSGTTGNPKGVILSHKAMLATIGGLQGLLDQVNEEMGPDDVYLSFLTMAHIFDRVAEEFMLHIGASIGYWQGDVRKLMDDVDALKPTLFAGVPRVFERIYNGVQDQIKKGGLLKHWIFQYAYNRKLWYMRGGWKQNQASVLSDLLVFNKIKAKLGGRIRLIVTGGAPIPAHVEEFLKVTMCAPLVQGYGLTETCAASFISFPHDFDQSFTVGPPMPHTELRLEAVPEMGYDPTADPPRGEVCIRGAGLFSGYYKDETMTKEVLDEDGFFHTGDVGEITPSGALRIIDRKKNLFKLSHGEYIAVERVENSYKGCELVEQLWIYGNSFESCLVAVLVPREPQLRTLAGQTGVKDAEAVPLAELFANKQLNTAVLAKLKDTAKAAGLKGFEEIKAVLLEAEPFSVENDLMTPSFKLKRPQLQKKYQSDITRMYDDLKKTTPRAS